MPSHRPLEDHTPQINRHRASYGGSDRSAAFFRTPQYVRWNSPSKALDLGQVSDLRYSLNSSLGGITGTQTHFIRVTLLSAAKLGARILDAKPCAIDWICIHFTDASHNPIPHGPSGYAMADETAIDPPSQTREQQTIVDSNLYVTGGYWESGYTVETFTILTPEGSTYTINSDAYTQEQSVSDPEPNSFDEFAARSVLAGTLSAGTYYILLTTSRWEDTPYQLQIVAIPPERTTSGDITLSFSPTASTGVSQLEGDAAFALEPYSRLQDVIALGPSLDGRFSPRLDLAVISPID